MYSCLAAQLQSLFSSMQHYEVELGLEAQENIGLVGVIKALQSTTEIQAPDQGLVS